MGEKIDGFVILGPCHTLATAFQTFGRTMEEAWLRHIGYRDFAAGELATLKGQWAAKGWRPVPAFMEIDAMRDTSTRQSEEPSR